MNATVICTKLLLYKKTDCDIIVTFQLKCMSVTNASLRHKCALTHTTTLAFSQYHNSRAPKELWLVRKKSFSTNPLLGL